MDTRLALMTGIDIPIEQCQLIMHQPTIKEISFLGETDFFVGVQTLCLYKSMFMDEGKSALESITNFQIFMTIVSNKETQDKKECVKKVLTLIEVHAVGSATLKVSTSFVEKEYKIQSGCNKIHCNICDESFYFNFIDKSNDFCAIKTNLTYIKLGE